jgi:hypothetical protein
MNDLEKNLTKNSGSQAETSQKGKIPPLRIVPSQVELSAVANLAYLFGG